MAPLIGEFPFNISCLNAPMRNAESAADSHNGGICNLKREGLNHCQESLVLLICTASVFLVLDQR